MKGSKRLPRSRRVFFPNNNNIKPGTQNALVVPRRGSWSPETADSPPQDRNVERRTLPRYYDPTLSEVRK